MRLRYQLFRNSISTLVWMGATTIVGLVLPPVLVTNLGIEVYGVWALIVLVNTYTSLLDLGFQSSMVKLVAEAEALGQPERIQRLFSVALYTYLMIILVGGLLSYLLGGLFSHYFLSEVSGYQDYEGVLQAYILVSLISLLPIPFMGLFKGLQRFDFTYGVDMLGLLLNAGVAIMLVTQGWGLWSLAAGAGASVTARLVLYATAARRYCRYLNILALPRQYRESVKALANLSPADFSVRIYNAVTQSVIRFAITYFIGISFVGIYDLARRIVIQVSGVASMAFIPLTPVVSSLASQDRKDLLDELMERAYLYLSMIALPLVYFFLLFYEPILKAWLNLHDISDIAFVGRLLLVAIMAEMYTGPLTTAALGLGKINVHLVYLISMGFLKIALVILGGIFSFRYLVFGDMASSLICVYVAVLYFVKLFNIRVDWIIVRTIFRASGPSLIVWISFYLIYVYLYDSIVKSNIFVWGGILGLGLIFVGLGFIIFKLLTSYELDLFINILRLRRT